MDKTIEKFNTLDGFEKLDEITREYLKKSNRWKRTLITLVVIQHLLFGFGIYKLFIGDLWFGWFHILLNGTCIIFNFRIIGRIKESMKKWKKMEDERQEIQKSLMEIGSLAVKIDILKDRKKESN